ncbi:MAG: alpha/beta hydrolase [Acidobacteria bacterium]|nr:alpha/beta hydrolase [Acidobacteriota bacterium]MCA1638672.1 alpha/beta hydrolase [Acidobacteriota bacterium]
MRIIITVLTLLFFTVLAFAQKNDQKLADNSKPFVLGVIDEIQSAKLGEKRILNIYLPEGYNKNDTVKYPVIYLLDGSADEDFIHVVGLVQFNNFPWINRVPKSIVVGIATVDRRRDFTYPTTIEADRKRYSTAGKSENFIGFIEQELQPFIEKKYKTTSSKTIIGQSLGGLLATEILLKKPTLFNKYIIISPSLWWDDASLLKQSSEILQNSFKQETDVYIGVGKEGLTPGDTPRVMEVDANLLTEKIKATKSKNVKVFFDYLPQEDHATVSHQAVFNAFRLLYPKTDNKVR